MEMFRQNNNYAIIVALCFILWCDYKTCNSEKISNFSNEHPKVAYFNKKYVSFLIVTIRRPGRSSLIYYGDVHLTSLAEANNSHQWDIYFYEYLSNTYRQTFVEMHFLTCDLIQEKFFGFALRNAIKSCPVPPGTYILKDCIIPEVPEGFPFRKGRVFLNGSYIKTKEPLLSVQWDMEIKEFSRKKVTGQKRRGTNLNRK